MHYTAQGHFLIENSVTSSNINIKEEFGVLSEGSRVCPPNYVEVYVGSEIDLIKNSKEMNCCPELTMYDAKLGKCVTDPVVIPHV